MLGVRRSRIRSFFLATGVALIVATLCGWYVFPRPVYSFDVNGNSSFIKPPMYLGGGTYLPDETAKYWQRWMVYIEDERVCFFDPQERIHVKAGKEFPDSSGGFHKDGSFVATSWEGDNGVATVHRFNPDTKARTQFEFVRGDSRISDDQSTLIVKSSHTSDTADTLQFTVIDAVSGDLMRAFSITPPPDADGVRWAVSRNGSMIAVTPRPKEKPTVEFQVDIYSTRTGEILHELSAPKQAHAAIVDYDVATQPLTEQPAEWVCGFFEFSPDDKDLMIETRHRHQVKGEWRLAMAPVCFHLSDSRYLEPSEWPPWSTLNRHSDSHPLRLPGDRRHVLWLDTPEEYYNQYIRVSTFDSKPTTDSKTCEIASATRVHCEFVPQSDGVLAIALDVVDSPTEEYISYLLRRPTKPNNERAVWFNWKTGDTYGFYFASFRETDDNRPKLARTWGDGHGSSCSCTPHFIGLMFHQGDRSRVDVWSAPPPRWQPIRVVMVAMSVFGIAYGLLRRQHQK